MYSNLGCQLEQTFEGGRRAKLECPLFMTKVNTPFADPTFASFRAFSQYMVVLILEFIFVAC